MVLNSGNSTYGTYYNWYAATAGSGKYSTSSGNASYSICPKGWRLPTGGSSGEFQTLYNNYSSSAAMRGDPVNFVLSGYRYGSSTGGQGGNGSYWSSTVIAISNAYFLYIQGSNTGPAYNGPKYYGFSMRCVVQ